MDAVGVIEILRRVFTYGDATNTHMDIVKYLNKIHIKESTYAKWGRNASHSDLDLNMRSGEHCQEISMRKGSAINELLDLVEKVKTE